MILSGQSIRARKGMFDPFTDRKVHPCGMSYGLSSCGYDIRVREHLLLLPGDFALASSLEHMDIPDDLLGQVVDKSSWARQGLAVQNTVIEPGWRGYLTLELTNHIRNGYIRITAGMPIAQIIFHQLDKPTDQPYRGKYQDQPDHPVAFIEEGTVDSLLPKTEI